MPLEVQRRGENDRVGPLEHLGCFFEFLLKFNVADDFCSLGHLSNELLQPPENANKAAFELVGELQEMLKVNQGPGRSSEHFQQENLPCRFLKMTLPGTIAPLRP